MDTETIVLEPGHALADDGHSWGLSQETLQSLICVMGEINAMTESAGFGREACPRATFSGWVWAIDHDEDGRSAKWKL